MRRLLYILLTAVALTLVMGCSRSVDKRLVLADTLMWTAPDSSLKILTAINRDSLQDKENLAYHALLRTQAQFRCNGNCESDTLINLALSHYSDNHIREHYTRSLMYKGAFNEVHDNPVEAIKWYKRAEDNADTTDYRNLAQINLRMGMLYYDNFADNKLCVSKFNKSLYYHQRIGDLNNKMRCMGYIGGLYRETNSKEAIKLLKAASDLAPQFNDSANYFWYNELLSRAFYLIGDYEESKKLSVYAIDNGGDYVGFDTYINAALAYAKLKMADSASYYLPSIHDNNHYDLMMLALAKSAIYEAQGKLDRAIEQNNLYNLYADSIEQDSLRHSAFTAELNMTKDDVINLKKEMSGKKKIIVSIILISLALIIALTLLSFYKRLQSRRLIHSLRGEKINMHSDLTAIIDQRTAFYQRLKESEHLSHKMHQDVINKEKECMALRNLVSSHIKLMEQLITASEEESERTFQKTFKASMANYHETEAIKESFISFVNQNFNSVVEKALAKAPALSVMEQYVIALMAAGFEYKEIAVVTNYSPSFIGKKRSRIEKKLGIDEKLIDFISRIKEEKD